MIRIDDVLDSILEKRSDADLTMVQRAYIYSAKQHEGQVRRSGEPYMVHPLTVAKIVSDMGLDDKAICAALLHDTIEDTDATREQLAELFDDDVANLVDGLTKLSSMAFDKKEQRQAESFRKMLIAMAKDIRVLLIKLADRLHNMQTLSFMKSASQLRIARETHDIYAPLADRLGIAWLKAELDDLSLKYLEPEVYKSLEKKIAKSKKQREQYISKTIAVVSDFLAASGFKADISGRMKNLHSIHKKMTAKGIPFENVHDAIAFRAICQSVSDCYAILGLVHSKWTPLPGRFRDYIALPKPNRYQSLHTTVVGHGGERIEIQIRTEEMHHIAEYGIAAHWKYKEGLDAGSNERAFRWLREMVENQNELRDSGEFLDTVKVDLFRDEVFVFTPNGDLIALQDGATALDFAYAIHTEVGNRCVGAKVNSIQVQLKTALKNGDWVDIMTSKSQRPSADWLDIAVTSRARTKIRSYLRTEQRIQSRQAGQELLEKALRKYGCSFSKMFKSGELDRVAADLKFGNVDDLLATVGYGKLDKLLVIDRLLPDERRTMPPPAIKEGALEKVMRKVRPRDDGIVLDGVDNLLVRFARCCNPLPGERIIGYVSQGRGIVIHRQDCPKASALDPARHTKVQWSNKAVSQRPVKLKVTTTNRSGILATLSATFQSMDVSLNSAHCDVNDHGQGVNIFTFQVKDVAHLNKIIARLKQSKHVLGVERMHS